jgi:hypothetical protein
MGRFFVSRAEHDELVQTYEQEARQLKLELRSVQRDHDDFRDRLLVAERQLEVERQTSRAWESAAMARYDSLLEKYHALKVAGAHPSAPLRPATPAPLNTEELAHERIREETVSRMASDFERHGVSRGEAEKEARRIAAGAFGQFGEEL